MSSEVMMSIQRKTNFMKIKDLIKLLQRGDPERDVYISSGDSEASTNIGVNFDDNGDADVYEVCAECGGFGEFSTMESVYQGEPHMAPIGTRPCDKCDGKGRVQ